MGWGAHLEWGEWDYLLIPDKLPRLISIALASGLSLGILILWWADTPTAAGLILEDGLVETLSAALWVLAAAACLVSAVPAQSGRVEWVLGGIIFLLFAARELDVQKLLAWNAGAPSNYWNPDIPLGERLTVLLVFVLPACSIVVAFVARVWSPFWEAWHEGLTWTRDVVIWSLMLFTATQLDKFHHVMPALGLDLSYRYIPHVFEEVLELTLALYATLLLFPLWKHSSGRTFPGRKGQPLG